MARRRRIDGVDLSHFQTDLKIDWPEAKRAGVKFVYHKATEGEQWHDQSYPTRRAEAKANGVPFGAYHFAHAKVGTAEAEAQHFLKYANPLPGDLAPALDLEVNENKMSEDQLAEWVSTFFMVVFKHVGKGAKGLLYTPFNISRVPSGVRLWVARYNDDNRQPRVPQPFHTWAVWQFTDGQFGTPSVVPGIGRVDADTLHRRFGFARLDALVLPGKKVKHSKPKPAPTPKPRESDIERLLRIAGSQVGYHEGRSNGHWDNIQKFSPAVPGLEWSQGQAWCATFVSWVAMKSGLDSLYPRTASTDTGAAWFKQRNQWSEYPAVGAQVFYGVSGNMEHTGLVYAYDADYIYTIEGNTNTNGSAEGDGVYRKKRARRDSYVQGYGYPAVVGGLKSADPNYKRSN